MILTQEDMRTHIINQNIEDVVTGKTLPINWGMHEDFGLNYVTTQEGIELFLIDGNLLEGSDICSAIDPFPSSESLYEQNLVQKHRAGNKRNWKKKLHKNNTSRKYTVKSVRDFNGALIDIAKGKSNTWNYELTDDPSISLRWQLSEVHHFRQDHTRKETLKFARAYISENNCAPTLSGSARGFPGNDRDSLYNAMIDIARGRSTVNDYEQIRAGFVRILEKKLMDIQKIRDTCGEKEASASAWDYYGYGGDEIQVPFSQEEDDHLLYCFMCDIANGEKDASDCELHRFITPLDDALYDIQQIRNSFGEEKALGYLEEWVAKQKGIQVWSNGSGLQSNFRRSTPTGKGSINKMPNHDTSSHIKYGGMGKPEVTDFNTAFLTATLGVMATFSYGQNQRP